MPPENSQLSLPFLDRLSTKITIAAVVFLFALTTAIAFLVAGGFRRTQFDAYSSNQETLTDQAQTSLLQFTGDQAGLLQAHLQPAALAVRYAADYLEDNIPRGDSPMANDSVTEFLETLLKSLPDVTALYYITAQGEFVSTSRQLTSLGAANITASPVYQLTAQSGADQPSILWYTPHIADAGSEASISVSAPVVIHGELLGVVAAGIPLAHLEEHLNAMHTLYDAFALLVDQQGRLVSISAQGAQALLGANASNAVALSANPEMLPEDLRGALNSLSGEQPAMVNFELSGKPAVLTYASLGEPPWNLVLVSPLDVITAQSQQIANRVWASAEDTIRYTLWMLLISSLAALIGTLVFLDRFFSRRIAALVKGVRTITSGDLDTRVEESAQDELGVLARSFNQMTSELRRRNAALLQTNVELDRSQELYRTLAHNFPNGAVLLFDENLRHTLADGAGLAEVGLSKEMLEGHTLWEAFPPETCAILEPQYRRALQGQETSFEVPFTGRTYLVWALPTRNESGEIFGGMLMTQDITERAQTQQILEQRVEQSTREIKQLYQQAEGRRHELETLYLADEQLYRHLRLDQVLQALVDVVIDQLQADKASVQVFDPASQRLVVRAARGYSPEMVARMSEYLPGDGISGKVFQSGQVIAVEDAAQAPAPADQIAAYEGICSVLSVPITIAGQIFGVFGMDYSQPRAFTPDDTRLFLALAQRAAIAIENARLFEQAEQAATLEERQRLSRELHDAVTQSLYSLVLLSEAGRRNAHSGNYERVEHHLDRLSETAQQALKEMRLLVYELRPMALSEVGLVGALQQRLDAVEKRAGVKALLSVEGVDKLPAPVEEAFFRIAQEALNNALKHAHASTVSVSLRQAPNSIEMELQDDGLGFDIDGTSPGGIGLHSMHERADRLGAEIEIQSTPGAGTAIRVRANLETAS